MATSLIDQYTLSLDATFQKRVQSAVVSAAVAIHGEAFSNITAQRDAFGKTVLKDMPLWIASLALGVAVDSTVAGLAGSPAAQANVTDAAISNAVSAMWNTFAVRN